MAISTFLSFAVSPVVIFLLIAYLKFKFSIKSLQNIINAVIWGALGVVLLVIANYLIDLQWNDNLRNMRRMAFFVFIITAFSSEIAKFAALRFGFFRLKSFQSPLVGIIYAVFISMGFSAVAVVLYSYGIVGTATKFNDMTLFLYTFPLAGFTLGCMMGFFVGMGRQRKSGFIDNSTAIFASTFFHGLFYFCFITQDKRLLIFTGIGFFIITIALILKAISLSSEKK
ncbi:MAG: PrsW family intramembrane metalloprotease [Chlorobi bacterium]|nr:PrsW family intramembrane metalloprotease [Chlorobiota bacterium]